MSITIKKYDKQDEFFSARKINKKNRKDLQEYLCENIYCTDKIS
jgi:hypothetical protein